MNLPEEFRADFERMPEILRRLLAAELEAGNTIVEVGHSHPAPPVGAYFKLARKVTTRARRSGDGLDFYERQSSISSGEFTDARRFFFLLEPPDPPPVEIDMDALRAARAAAERVEDGRRQSERAECDVRPAAIPDRTDQRPTPREDSIVARFRASMALDFEKWKDGIGYDVALIESANEKEKAAIESLLLSRSVDDWRDVEALAALGTPAADSRLTELLATGTVAIAVAVLRHASRLVSDVDRTRVLVRALESSDFSSGLTQAMLEVESHHPPEVIDALFDAVIARDGTCACHFAAMLMFLHQKAAEPFDDALRPYFLRFTTGDPVRRRELCDDLRRRIGRP